MRSDRRAPVAIVGGGFSGTVLLAELTRRGVPALLIEGGGRAGSRAGKGTANSTREPAHVLNFRAEVMSARADDAGHFARFVEAEGGKAEDIVQRRQFGRYLRGQLAEAQAAAERSVRSRPSVPIDRTRDPLLRQLRPGAGLARPLGIALDVDDRSRTAGADRLWALGPMTKGRYWEIIAVPDIRVQVAAVAEDIAKEFAA